MDVLRPGAVFAGHRIERLLGAGGMGEVYLARESDSGRDVALKVLAPHVAGDARFRRRFERESRLLRDLDHPHVVGIHAVGEHDGRLFITLSYVPGPDLAALLAERGTLHPRHAAIVVAQIGAALDAAAARGLVHRDVKPGNIFLRGRGDQPYAYLGDFGLSRYVSSTSGLTRTGHWVGTIDYAAPEQLQADEVDQRADIYALAAVLFAALTGEIPFPRRRDVDKMVAHLSEPPPRPSRRAETVPAAFDHVVARGMAKLPGERHPRASELGAEALAAAATSGPAPPWRLRLPVTDPRADPDAPTAA
ncbi:MAG: serine/threonine protein kinase [Thermoleophilaceae bacterium]|nr:serine/threonine protein kinase [Thermoleophilaceae bacterium]